MISQSTRPLPLAPEVRVGLRATRRISACNHAAWARTTFVENLLGVSRRESGHLWFQVLGELGFDGHDVGLPLSQQIQMRRPSAAQPDRAPELESDGAEPGDAGERQVIGAVLEGGERVDRQRRGRLHGAKLEFELSAVALLEVARSVAARLPRSDCARDGTHRLKAKGAHPAASSRTARAAPRWRHSSLVAQRAPWPVPVRRSIRARPLEHPTLPKFNRRAGPTPRDARTGRALALSVQAWFKLRSRQQRCCRLRGRLVHAPGAAKGAGLLMWGVPV